MRSTQHDRFLLDDYLLLRNAGIYVVREGISWAHVALDAGRYDLSAVDAILDASAKAGLEVIFDLFHFGYPDDQDPFSPQFADAFSDYCFAVAKAVDARGLPVTYFTPINEPSYLAWAGGEVGLFAPYATGRGWELKVCLAKAAIEGINAIRTAAPGARMVNVDPLCWIVPSSGRPEEADVADDYNSRVLYQSWDILAGRLLPELGGSRSHLDIVGVNYYAINQWELNAPYIDQAQRILQPLKTRDARRRPFHRLLDDVWRRFGCDLLVTETGSTGRLRGPWLRRVAGEVRTAIEDGIPVRGLCLYPALSMPLWHDPSEWSHMGLWDLCEREGVLKRVPARCFHEALGVVQAEPLFSTSSGRRNR